MSGLHDPRRVVWPHGEPREAVLVHGLLARWWAQFRLGWSLDPRKLRQVCTATIPHGDDGSNPEASARHWELVMFTVFRPRFRQEQRP